MSTAIDVLRDLCTVDNRVYMRTVRRGVTELYWDFCEDGTGPRFATIYGVRHIRAITLRDSADNVTLRGRGNSLLEAFQELISRHCWSDCGDSLAAVLNYDIIRITTSWSGYDASNWFAIHSRTLFCLRYDDNRKVISPL